MNPADNERSRSVFVLVAAEEQSVATAVEATLRNAGWAARTAWAKDIEDVDEALSRSEPDLLICSTALEVAAIANLARQFSPELPVLAVAGHGQPRDGALLAGVTGAGAADLVLLDDEADRRHFENVCQREYQASVTAWTLRQARMRIAEFQSRQRLLMAGTTRALLTVSEGIIVDANPAAADHLGFEKADQLVAQPLLDLIVPADRDLLREHLAQLAKRRIAEADVECHWQRADGSEISTQLRLSNRDADEEHLVDLVLRPLATPSTAGAAGSGVDFSGIREAATQLVGQAMHNSEPHGVMFCCIDGYFDLEQRIGMCQAARVADTWLTLLTDQLPARSDLFRLCAHELVAVVPAESTERLEGIAQALCREVAQQSFASDAHDCHLTISVALYPLGSEGVGAEDVLRDASSEARALSHSGGNAVRAIGDAARAAARERAERAAADSLRTALKEKDRLRLAYQLISNLGDQQREMYDVLVRLADASGRELHAREFLPIAERYGLMPEVDRWVFRRAAQVLEKRGDPNTTLLLRLSEATLVAPDALLQQLKEEPPAPKSIAVQVREPYIQHQIRKAVAFREQLAELQLDFVIDYFGDGASAPTLLDKLKPDFVKFAPRFAQDSDDEEVHKRLLALIKSARNANARIIIPFVENTRVMGELWQIGINYVQGYGLHEAEAVMLASEAAR